MRVGLLGGSGFIGTYVTEQLLWRGDEVLILDHHKGKEHASGAEVFLGDVCDDVAVTEFAAHVDGLIHLAAVLGTQETIVNPRPAAKVNVLGSLNVFEAATQYDLPCVYFAVGNAWMRSHGAGAYVISKTCAEDFIAMYNKHRGSRLAAIRPMNAYGPRQSASKPFGWSPVRKIMPAFICRALSEMPVEVYGDGEQVSDMIWVGDVARAAVGALDALVQGEQLPTVEVGPSDHRTVNEVALLVIEEVKKQTGRESVLTHLPMRPGEVPNARVVADTSTLKHVGVDENTLVPLDEGVHRTVNYFVENEGVTWNKP
jgi:UDP-glucose 4-epimerase